MLEDSHRQVKEIPDTGFADGVDSFPADEKGHRDLVMRV